MSARFASASSQHPEPSQAIGEVAGAVLESSGAGLDLAVMFVAGHHLGAIDELVDAADAILAPRTLIAAGSSALIEGARGLGAESGVVLWSARVGPVTAVRLEALQTSEGTAVVGMPAEAATPGSTLMLLATPNSVPIEAFTDAAADQYPELTIVGAVTSSRDGQHRLAVEGAVHEDGAVGVLLAPTVSVSSRSAHRCRPVGEPFIVTAAHGNVVAELAGRSAYSRLADIVAAADEGERELLARGLQIGLVVDESLPRFGSGDFVARAVAGADAASGTVTLGCRVEVGTTVQFHVADPADASAALRHALADTPGSAALLFSGTQRGGEAHRATADRDAALVSASVGAGPVAGIASQAEIGPIGGRSHLQGLSASVLVFH